MKAKGVATKVLKASQSFQSFYDCLMADASFRVDRHRILRIHSQNQQVRTDFIIKQTLTPLDSKRYKLDATRTLPYTHF
jgi:hypothetical protein